MKKLDLFIYFILLAQLVIGQPVNKYVLPGETFYTPEGKPLFALRKIVLTNTPQNVPSGKIWMTAENKYITVQLASNVNEPNTMCCVRYKKTPKVMFSINSIKPYEKRQRSGVIFSDYIPADDGTPNKISFIPDAFINSDFDLSFLNVMVPRMVGQFDIKFLPGTSLWMDSCLTNFEMIEIDMPVDEWLIYKAQVDAKKVEYDNYIAEIERKRLEAIDNAMREKIRDGYIFTLSELDKKPKYGLHEANFIELYKKIYYNKFYIDFIINETGDVTIFPAPDQKFDITLLKEFLKYTPGTVTIQNKEIPVKTRMKLIFTSDNIVQVPNSDQTVKVKKRDKEPYIKVKEYPEFYPEKQLNKLVGFRKVLRKFAEGNYLFNLEKDKMTIEIYINEKAPENLLINQKIEKVRFKYRAEEESNWRF
jgi:hypothetical protein